MSESAATGWYYLKSGASPDQRVGPMTWDELYDLCSVGTLDPADFVWSPARARWLLIGQIPAFPPSAAPPAVSPVKNQAAAAPAVPSIATRPRADGAPFCPYCKTAVALGAETVVCPTCDLVHHADCWQENQGCSTYGCGWSGAPEKKRQGEQAVKAPDTDSGGQRRGRLAASLILPFLTITAGTCTACWGAMFSSYQIVNGIWIDTSNWLPLLVLGGVVTLLGLLTMFQVILQSRRRARQLDGTARARPTRTVWEYLSGTYYPRR